MQTLHPLTSSLLNWYGKFARPLPWRADPNPYSTWLSEVILQQTRVDQGTAYWERFMVAFPTVQDLASAETDQVMALWKGLGYYSRARNLHNAARIIVGEHAGVMPKNAEEWSALPGVGPYTAAAISSICCGEAVPVVDGNVQRVMSRLFDIEHAVDRKAGKQAVDEACQMLLDVADPGTSNQAWMELGALICAPKSPLCAQCPLMDGCLARERKTMLQRPVKQPKKAALAVEVSFSIALRQEPNSPLQWWVERRPEKGIWSQLEAFPCVMTPLSSEKEAAVNTGLFAERDANDARFGPVKHILTHRRMTAYFEVVQNPPTPKMPGRWVDVSSGDANWPRLIDKVLPELRAWIVKN
ncbi:A/G-specific adenine glycosylase [Flavobacteriales bacterium]|nr:A/G-specific adenine glycosylase [Flavobacteriales bacterium]